MKRCLMWHRKNAGLGVVNLWIHFLCARAIAFPQHPLYQGRLKAHFSSEQLIGVGAFAMVVEVANVAVLNLERGIEEYTFE